MITTKQRAYLRGLANRIDSIIQIGKGDINENILIQAKEALEARELIKLNVLENSEYTARDAATIIADAIDCDIVQVIGKRFVLYKESEKNKKIFLPR